MATKKELAAKYTELTGNPVPTKWNKTQLQAEIAVAAALADADNPAYSDACIASAVASKADELDHFAIPEALQRVADDDAPSVTPTPVSAPDTDDADPRTDDASSGDDDAPETEGDDDAPEGDAEEERGPRTVVKESYRREYRARTKKGTHCNDYLARVLEDVFVDGKKFDTDAFTLCLAANNVPLVGKWAALPSSGQKGWQGRYRMNGRLQLERIVVATAQIAMPDGSGGYVTEQVDDVEWLLARASKLNVDCQWEINDEGNIEQVA